MSGEDHVEFYFDITSPYAYIAATQVDDVVAAAGRVVVWRPFLLGAVFQATGNEMPARLPAKASWMRRDLELQCQRLGLPFRFPDVFPLRSVGLLRALLAAEREAGQDAMRRLALGLYGAYWGQGRDVNDPTLFAEICAAAGLDPERMAAANADPAMKQALVTNTERAVKQGAFGAPTFVVDGTLFWGHDRLPLLQWHIEQSAER